MRTDPKQIKALELSIQHGSEEKVEYDPVERLVGIYNDIVDPDRKQFTPAEYAELTSSTEKDVTKQMELAQIMVDFLDFIEQPRQFHICKNLSMGAFFTEIPALLKKCKSEGDEESVKNIAFTKVLLSSEGDRVRQIRLLKKILEGPNADMFINRGSDIAAEACERITEGASNSDFMTRIAELRSDTKLSDDLDNLIETQAKEAERQKVAASPCDAIKKAWRNLNQVEETLFPELGKADLRELSRELKTLQDRVSEIDNALSQVTE